MLYFNWVINRWQLVSPLAVVVIVNSLTHELCITISVALTALSACVVVHSCILATHDVVALLLVL